MNIEMTTLTTDVSVDRSDMPIIFITGCGDVFTSVQAAQLGLRAAATV